jgi:hypothetical protein
MSDRSEITRRCIEHMVQRLDETPASHDPFPHFWTQNILPDDIFQRLLDELPPFSLYRAKGEESRHYGNRADLHLLSETIEQLPGASQELWYGLRAALSSTRLKEAIFARLAKGIAHRFGISQDAVPGVAAYPRTLLYRETEGYRIAPHPDTRRKLATVQFALTDDPSQSELGTSMYRLSAHPSDLLSVPRGFREVGRKPFLRNSVFAFAVVNTISMRSWHGREPLPPDCGIRNTLLHIYYENAADANPEMVAEMMQSEQGSKAA